MELADWEKIRGRERGTGEGEGGEKEGEGEGKLQGECQPINCHCV